MLTVGSLFSGIGGFDLGLERAGMRTEWFVEQDEFCQRVLNKHWPNRPIFDDVRHVCGQSVWPERRYYLEPVDVLCGGFPCQDISVAGKGAGIDGARSGLWAEYARLIGELRPRYVIVENVSALLGRGLGVVLGDLAEIGYDAEWDCLPASAVGAPHRRDRVWLVAYPNDGRSQAARVSRSAGAEVSKPGFDSSCDLRSDPEGFGRRQGREGRSPSLCADGKGFSTQELADAEGERHERTRQTWDGRTGPTDGGSGVGSWPSENEGRSLDDPLRGRHGAPQGQVPTGRHGAVGAGWWSAEPDVGRVAHGVPARVDRLRSLGNALVPQIAEWIGRRIMTYEESIK